VAARRRKTAPRAARSSDPKAGKAARSAKLQQEFVSEAEEILERMRDDLSTLAEATAQGREVAPTVVNQLFRSAHSLKGLSGMFEMAPLVELAHHLEDILDRFRLGRSTLGSEGLALLDESVALAAAGLEKVGHGEPDETVAEAIADLVGRIAAWSSEPDAPLSTQAGALPEHLLRALTEYEESRLQDNLRRGRSLALIDVEFPIASFEEALGDLNRALHEIGEVISTLPSPAASREAGIRFELLVASELTAPTLAGQLGLDATAVRAATAPEETAKATSAPADPAVLHEADSGTLKSLSNTVRVDIRKLDELLNLVGELARERSALGSLVERLASQPGMALVGAELEKLRRTLDRKAQALQAGVLDVRMVPLRQVFDKLARVVRRLRIDLGKDVELQIQGADTELDKLIVEELVDPLVHLVRNAFDHAIEPAAERGRAGKAGAGVIRLEASQRGNDVAVSVTDDGRGIDPEAVRARAIEHGLITADEVLSGKELFGLLFAPGFSTRTEVSATSGRGVGLDVVRENVSALGGLVDVDSTLGEGTRVTLTLPITLAIVQALLVTAGGQRFAVPLGGVRETLGVAPGEIQQSAGRELLNLRGEALPVCRLVDEFALAPVDTSQKQFAVVLGIGDVRIALLVDSLDGQQDAVIKPVQGPVPNVRGVAGATELGDGSTLLVLDVSALVEDGTRRREAR
jgi:two-component system chemotaxis sensor kinase CheA